MVLGASTESIRNGTGSGSNNKSINNKDNHHNNSNSHHGGTHHADDHSSDDAKSTASYESSRKNGSGSNHNAGSHHSGNMKSVKNKTGEYEAEKIRVGRDYQVVCPELIPEKDRNPDGLIEKALLVWSPTKDIPEKDLDKYIYVAREKYGYNGEQALGMLFWHRHDLERAIMDLANFTPFPDEWTVEDKVLFEQAFQFHGKSFNRIRQMLPDKSIASLVKYYYSWKKNRARPNVLDRPERNKNKHGVGSENGESEEPESNEVSDLEEKITIDEDTPKSSPPPTSQNDTNQHEEDDVTLSTSANKTTTNSNENSLSERPKKTQSPATQGDVVKKPEIEITQISSNNKRQHSTSSNSSPNSTPNLDEITIVPISRRQSADKDGAPPAKQIKLNENSSVSVSVTAAGGP